jgi:hypothetical protein
VKKIFGFLLQICCLFLVVPACGQANQNVVKLHAFIMETVEGNIPVDEKGEPVKSGVDHLHFIFAETTGKVLPQWNVVYTRYGVFTVQPEKIDSATFTVGKKKNSSEMAKVSARRGNQLWQFNLIPMKARTPGDIAEMLKSNAVVVVVEFKGEQYKHKIAKATELETILYK